MRVFKFGGASINGAEAIKNVVDIISRFNGDKLVVVISAMGKTTNTLEDVVKYTFDNQAEEAKNKIAEVEANHKQVAKDLFNDDGCPVLSARHSVMVLAGIYVIGMAGQRDDITGPTCNRPSIGIKQGPQAQMIVNRCSGTNTIRDNCHSACSL